MTCTLSYIFVIKKWLLFVYIPNVIDEKGQLIRKTQKHGRINLNGAGENEWMSFMKSLLMYVDIHQQQETSQLHIQANSHNSI
jgi:hypothetical protein